MTARYTVGSEPANVEIGIATVPEPANRHVLPLDSVHDGITVGSWVAIERPRKGAEEPDGIPGDEKLAFVTTQVTAVRTAAYTNYGITGRGTELDLADPWLDEHDVLLSHIRDATVHAGGEPLRPADEPLGEDVHGNRARTRRAVRRVAPRPSSGRVGRAHRHPRHGRGPRHRTGDDRRRRAAARPAAARATMSTPG